MLHPHDRNNEEAFPDDDFSSHDIHKGSKRVEFAPTLIKKANK